MKINHDTLSVLIVNWNTRDLLAKCLESLSLEAKNVFDKLSIETQIIVVDNNSADGSLQMVSDLFKDVTLIANSQNYGFAYANNQAYAVATGFYILMLNPDTIVLENSIITLIEFLQGHKGVGIVAPQLLNTDLTIQKSCRSFPTIQAMFYELLGLSKINQAKFGQYKMLDFNHDFARSVDQPEGACLLTTRDVIDKCGFLDNNFFMLFEEVDWCYRVKQAGYDIWFEPGAKIIHHYGQAIKQVKSKMIFHSHKGFYLFWKKHYRQNNFWLDPFVYVGLYILAMLRVVQYKIKSVLG